MNTRVPDVLASSENHCGLQATGDRTAANDTVKDRKAPRVLLKARGPSAEEPSTRERKGGAAVNQAAHLSHRYVFN